MKITSRFGDDGPRTERARGPVDLVSFGEGVALKVPTKNEAFYFLEIEDGDIGILQTLLKIMEEPDE